MMAEKIADDILGKPPLPSEHQRYYLAAAASAPAAEKMNRESGSPV
jgi:hypothetical protein